LWLIPGIVFFELPEYRRCMVWFFSRIKWIPRVYFEIGRELCVRGAGHFAFFELCSLYFRRHSVSVGVWPLSVHYSAGLAHCKWISFWHPKTECYSDFRCARFLYPISSIVSCFYFDSGVCTDCVLFLISVGLDLFWCRFVCRLISIIRFDIYTSCDLEEWIILMSFWFLPFLYTLLCPCSIQINVTFIPLPRDRIVFSCICIVFVVSSILLSVLWGWRLLFLCSFIHSTVQSLIVVASAV